MNVRRNFCLFYAALLALAVSICVLPSTVWAESIGATIDMSDPNPPPSGTGWTYAGDVYTIQSGADVMVTGDNQSPNPSQRRIAVEPYATAKITLDGVSIMRVGNNRSPLLLNAEANVTLTWTEGSTNTLSAEDSDYAGIQTTGAELTIEGPESGSLTARAKSGAGIGGQMYVSGGTITITSGTITATSSSSGAGIGGGYNGSGGQITITGGTVTARGGSGSAGIGGGYHSSGGQITITGGTVTATGGMGFNDVAGGAGIGSGGTSNASSVAAGTITITVPVTATGGAGADTGGKGADIGAGGYNGGDGPEEAFHTITASAGPNGSIKPSGDLRVYGNPDVTYTLSPDIGYVVDIVSADNVAVGAVNSYTFDDVAENHTIEAAFRPADLAPTPKTSDGVGCGAAGADIPALLALIPILRKKRGR